LKFDTPKFPVHEWIAVLSISSILLLLVVINLFNVNTSSYGELIAQSINYVNVTLEGELLNPGTYQVKKGATVKEVLNLAKLTADADVSTVDKSLKLLSDQIIRVKSIPKTTVYVEGAVKIKGRVDVPLMYSIEDLLEFVGLSANANIDSLGNIQRKVRSEEVIKVDSINIRTL